MASGFVALVALIAMPPASAVSVGVRVPDFESADLLGHPHRFGELEGTPAIVIVAVGRKAAATAVDWGSALDPYLAGRAVRLVALVVVHVPFFVSDDLVRSMARRQAPRSAWLHTWLSTDGQIAAALQLKESDVAYVLSLDAHLAITSIVHEPASAQSVERVLSSLGVGRPEPGA